MNSIFVIKMKSVIEWMTALFVFFLMIDPGDVIFRLKLPLFILLLGVCMITYPKINYGLLKTNVLFYGILILTSLTGFFMSYKTDNQMQMQLYKTFVMILLLPWCKHLKVLKTLFFPAVIIGLVVISIYFTIQIFPVLELPIYTFTQIYSGTIFLSHRTFLGIDIFSVYYTSLPVLLLLLPVILQRIYSSPQNAFRYKVLFVIVFLALLIGGTRALMLSGISIVFIMWLMKIWQKKYGKIVVGVVGMMVLAAAMLLLYFILNDTGEESLEVKSVLAEAFFRHIEKRPETLLWGNGVGAVFDSLGVRGENAALSELLYLELIRWFGVPLTIVFLMVYIYPVFLIYRKKDKLKYGISLITGYIFYLFLAGTNPYLIGSNGLLALLIMYSYAYNPYYEQSVF